ncbi:hypothetical protein M8J76_003704 [Diaphorina citri]|nr:hypothetical protein M8J76_003704 [Diaphorina citri]
MNVFLKAATHDPVTGSGIPDREWPPLDYPGLRPIAPKLSPALYPPVEMASSEPKGLPLLAPYCLPFAKGKCTK